VTIKVPPNNKHFDIASVTRISPVLQHRKAEQEAANNRAPAVAPAPVFNLSIGNEVANLLRPAQPLAIAPATPPILPAMVLSLLEPSRLPGPDMPINDFFHLYDLGDAILQKFLNNGYAHPRMLCFVQLSELKEMNFMLGEVAVMKDAVKDGPFRLLGEVPIISILVTKLHSSHIVLYQHGLHT
jgi:hypothetical protein